MIEPMFGDLMLSNGAEWCGGSRFAGLNPLDDTDSELVMAARCVAETRRIVARQRAHILNLKANGGATPDHELTLQAFASALAELESHTQELVEAAKRFERSKRLLS